MGGLMCRANSDSEEFVSKLCLYSLDYEESYKGYKHEQCNSMKKENSLKAILLGDLDIVSTNENDDLMAQELGIDLDACLHIDETPISNMDGICNRKDMEPSLDTNALKDTSKCAIFLCSEMEQPYPFAFELEEGLSSTIVHIESLLEAESSTSTCSTSTCSTTPPSTPKLVSAMKGSRAEHGTPPETKLSVTWAPEVYDPPVTSASHTVKGRRVHYRAKKKDPHKQKHGKGKSSRGTVFDRKHGYRRITTVRS